jgi:hypothetical protein
MRHLPCSTPGCPDRVPADSPAHRIVLRDAGAHVLGVLYYCSSCLEHFAAYGAYGHFAPRPGSPPQWQAWLDEQWPDQG